MCVQWVAAHPLSRIVVVVFVVILSVVVVVCRLGPSSSTFPPSFCLRRCFRWREHDWKTTADNDHDLEEDDEDNDNDS